MGGLLASAMVASHVSQLGAARGQPGDGEQEVGRLRRIGLIDNGLGGALGRDETGVAVLPAIELPVEKSASGGVAGEGRQVSVEAGEKSCGAVQLRRSLGIIFAFRRHQSFPAVHCCREVNYTM